MMTAFTRNYEDNSTDAGYQFTFYCDNCRDGFKTSFIESSTYRKGRGLRTLSEGAGILGNLVGGRLRDFGYASQSGGDALSRTFDGQSPAWQQEHQAAFERSQNEARQHFHRCNSCTSWVCDACHNEDEGLCVSCAPRQEIFVAKARADAMQRNINEAGQSATVWQGAIESKTTACPNCGKPAGAGKFCNNCGSSMEMQSCARCGAKNALTVRFCNNCGNNLAAASVPSGLCGGCGFENQPGTRFCGNCGNQLM